MKQFLLSLATLAISSAAFAGSDDVIRVDCSRCMPEPVVSAEQTSNFKYTLPSTAPQALQPTAQAEKIQALPAKVKIKVIVPEDGSQTFLGYVYFNNEEFGGSAEFKMDPDTWEYDTEATVQIPAGTYDVMVQWRGMFPDGTTSVIKEQVTIPDVDEIVFDPAEATCMLSNEFRNQEGKLISNGVKDADGNIIRECVAPYYQSQIWVVANFKAFYINGIWTGGLGGEYADEMWARNPVCRINPLSDRYMAFGYLNAHNDETAWACGSQILKIDDSHVFSAEGQTWDKIDINFVPTVASEKYPFSDPENVPATSNLQYYLAGITNGGSSFMGPFKEQYVSLPSDPVYNSAFFAFIPEAPQSEFVIENEDGDTEVNYLSMESQPLVKDGDDYKIVNIFKSFSTQNPDIYNVVPEKILFEDYPFNISFTDSKLQLGNSAPILEVTGFPFGRDLPIYRYSFVSYGRLGENRTGVDQLLVDAELKVDGVTVAGNVEELDNWINSNGFTQYTESTFDFKMTDSNVLIDGTIEGYTSARTVTDFATGDINAPVIQRMISFEGESVASDRFATAADGRILIAGGDFTSTFDPSFGCWWQQEAAPEIEVMYSPRGANDWAPLTATEIAEYARPSVGHVWEVSTAEVDRESADGWYDLAITLIDKADNFGQNIISPAFNIASIVGVDKVAASAKGSTVVKGTEGAIVVAGIDETRVEVYTTAGQLVADTTASRIPVAKGIYIVRVNGTDTYKVAVR